MKKLLVVLGVVAVGFAFTSCKKDCICNSKVLDADGKVVEFPGTMKDQSVGELSKSDCEAYKVPALSLGEGYKFEFECKSK